MEMTEFEIVKDYSESADKAAQIGILADLNLCSPADIVGVLQKNGEAVKQGRNIFDNIKKAVQGTSSLDPDISTQVPNQG